MAFIPSVAISGKVGAPSVIIFTDTSTGDKSEYGITERHIYLRKAVPDTDGAFLVPSGSSTDYIVWGYSGDSPNILEIDILKKDMALQVVVEWLSPDPDGMLINSVDFLMINPTDKFII